MRYMSRCGWGDGIGHNHCLCVVIKLNEPLYSDRFALKDIAALEDKYLGKAWVQYASVRQCAASDNWAGRDEFGG